MHFDLLKPCSNCPFLRVGGIRLHEERVKEIARYMLDSVGGTFACHKTTVPVDTEDGPEMAVTKDSRHCAGALIFAERNGNCTNMMRVMERLKFYDHKKLMADQETVNSVFSTLKEMLATNRKESFGNRRRKKKAKHRRMV